MIRYLPLILLSGLITSLFFWHDYRRQLREIAPMLTECGNAYIELATLKDRLYRLENGLPPNECAMYIDEHGAKRGLHAVFVCYICGVRVIDMGVPGHSTGLADGFRNRVHSQIHGHEKIVQRHRRPGGPRKKPGGTP